MPTEAKLVSTVIPPPVAGWSTKQPISAMDPMYSPEMENWFPDGGIVKLRAGSAIHATGVGTTFVTGMGSLTNAAGSFIVAIGTSSGRAYSSTSSGGAASDISGGVNFGGPCNIFQFRDRVFIKSGNLGDDVYHWTGAGNIALSNFVGPGGDDKDLVSIGSYKSRLYFSQYSVPSIWYPGGAAGVDAITGALTEFPLSSLLQLGSGLLVIYFAGSISSSTEAQGDDLFCVVTRFGEVLIFEGDNPGATTWSLIRRFKIPRPASEKAFFYMGGSLCVITENGLISINDLMRGKDAFAYPTLSDEIGSVFKDTYDATFGYIWNTGVHYPVGNYAILGYSPDDITPNAQLVYNSVSGAWTKFTGMEAYCWLEFLGSLYYGSKSGKIMKADTGSLDENPASAATYLTQTRKLRHAVNYFGEPRSTKRMVHARPIFLGSRAAGNITINSDCDMDYANNVKTATASFISGSATEALYQHKVGLTGSGKAASYRIDAVTADTLKLQATEIFYNKGDV